jgi:hypothetical protein
MAYNQDVVIGHILQTIKFTQSSLLPWPEGPFPMFAAGVSGKGIFHGMG